MIYARVRHNNNIKFGFICGDKIDFISNEIISDYKLTGESAQISEISYLSPTVPSKVVAVGLNYRDHIKEMNNTMPQNPIIFIKPSTAVIGDGDIIIRPSQSKQVDYEAELAIVVKKQAKNISPENAKDYILGYTCLNDVTARDLQSMDGQWTRAKGFDTFCPIGPVVTDEVDPLELDVKSYLNGELKQFSNTREFIWNVYELFSFISDIMTLMPGDVITTGTPSGIGAMKPGDKIEIVVEGIGTLTNIVE